MMGIKYSMNVDELKDRLEVREKRIVELDSRIAELRATQKEKQDRIFCLERKKDLFQNEELSCEYRTLRYSTRLVEEEMRSLIDERSKCNTDYIYTKAVYDYKAQKAQELEVTEVNE